MLSNNVNLDAVLTVPLNVSQSDMKPMATYHKSKQSDIKKLV